ncbi:hypothetical protein Syun_020000 [Stephania yunnanensis]|uniref:O-methyltransferase C-terminal domain-containing protein n=1 Tax=Stephania yunnanensis TaxID=152371 RepID=A0AAP0IV76_9MAGN
MKMLVSKYPQIKGINFDLPHVIADAPPYPGKMLVYEYIDNGNLEQWLHGDVGLVSPLTWEIRMNIILGTQKGTLHDGREESFMKRTTLVANTSNMHVAAREASIYTLNRKHYNCGILQRYGLQCRYDGDSTSRWVKHCVKSRDVCYGLHLFIMNSGFVGVKHVPGDMFKGVPNGDIMFMKFILHGFDDEHCVAILKNCWNALPRHGKLLIAEYVLPSTSISEFPDASRLAFTLDAMMLVYRAGGKERTLVEYEELGKRAGFHGMKAFPCSFGIVAIELQKESS